MLLRSFGRGDRASVGRRGDPPRRAARVRRRAQSERLSGGAATSGGPRGGLRCSKCLGAAPHPAAAATHPPASLGLAVSSLLDSPPRWLPPPPTTTAVCCGSGSACGIRRADGTTHLVVRRPRADLAPTLCARRLQAVSLALKTLAARGRASSWRRRGSRPRSLASRRKPMLAFRVGALL